uniref:NADH dehydrogenase subunit 2 n=1 Tax=Euseius nicholsi TaxID=702746 RepID=A0A0U1ZE54_9ACAR|nr:NADH dehydrogenase subunit 2 [Euseius nicholsi]
MNIIKKTNLSFIMEMLILMLGCVLMMLIFIVFLTKGKNSVKEMILMMMLFNVNIKIMKMELLVWMSSNLGKNPKKGGSPSMLEMFNENKNFYFQFLKLNVLSSEFVLKFLSIVNTHNDIMSYMMSYNSQLFEEEFILISIQLNWFKEEQFNNHRILLWVVISKELYTLLIITAKDEGCIWMKFVKITQIGKIFCIMFNMSHIFHSMFSVIWKYHVLNGNKPNFIHMEINNIMFKGMLITFMELLFIYNNHKNILLLTLWISKYFIIEFVSVNSMFWCSGMKIIMFSSMKIQINNMLFLEMQNIKDMKYSQMMMYL